MKRTIQATMIVLLIVAAGVAAAAESAMVNVSARVVGTCRFSSASANLAFGDLPFDGAGNATGTLTPVTTNMSFWCTNGATYTITDDNGQNAVGTTHRMISNLVTPAEFIDYTLTYAPTTGTGGGPLSSIPLTVTGSVGATYTNNTPATYTDTVTLTINP